MQMLTAEVKFQAQGKDYSVTLSTLANLPNQAGTATDEYAIVKIELNKMHAFTLIEMVLAIGVAAMVLIAVNTALFASLRLRDATANVVDAATPVDQAVTFIRRDLQCVVTPTNGTSKVLSGGFRAGNVNSPGVAEPVAIEMFTATGALSANAPWADIQRVTYELKQPTDRDAVGRDLYRSVVRNLLTHHDAGRAGPVHVERRPGHQIHLLRRRAMAGHLGHDRRDLDLHQPAARRPRGHPDGRKQQRERAAD